MDLLKKTLPLKKQLKKFFRLAIGLVLDTFFYIGGFFKNYDSF